MDDVADGVGGDVTADALPAAMWQGELPPFATLITALAALDDDEDDDAATLEELRMTLAIELEVRDDGAGATRVTGATPTQWIETTVLPAFQRLSVRVVRTRDDA